MALFIGIDPGEHTGLAVWDSATRSFRVVATLPLHKAMQEVHKWTHAAELTCYRKDKPVHVVCEDARQRTWFAPERNASEYRGKLMGAGAAKRDVRIWEEFLEDRDVSGSWLESPFLTFEMHKPQKGGTKWPAETFANITGYTGRTSEHSRDAALLVYGRR